MSFVSTVREPPIEPTLWSPDSYSDPSPFSQMEMIIGTRLA